MASAFQPIYGKVVPSIAPAPSLMGALEKLAKAGELAGFSIQDMIDMLNGGLSVADLLEVLACCLHDKRKPLA